MHRSKYTDVVLNLRPLWTSFPELSQRKYSTRNDEHNKYYDTHYSRYLHHAFSCKVVILNKYKMCICVCMCNSNIFKI